MYVKVCGITQPEEIDLLETLPVNLVGLWHGVPGGRADLSLAACQRLAAAACATDNLEPVLVTFLNDTKTLREVINFLPLRWVQLHGYQTPGLVRAVKRTLPEGVRIIKVLHVQQERCLEASLVHAYEKAGVDAFLFDVTTDDGRIGSTGRPLDSRVVSTLAKRLTRPFLLAGGINSENWREHASSIHDPHWLGIDLDTNARGRDGALQPDNIEAIIRAWTAGMNEGRHHD
jgi:phosphoribosylanthranilate isomerase